MKNKIKFIVKQRMSLFTSKEYFVSKDVFYVKYYKDSVLTHEIWYKKSCIGRDDDQPSLIIYRNNEIYSCQWYTNDRLQRKNDLPSYVNKVKKIWHKDGLRHRLKKPAVIFNSGRREWWIKDKRIKKITKKEYQTLVYCAVQLYKNKKYVLDVSINRKWYGSNILEPKLTGIICSYIN